jgi:hypothetical protein
VRSATCSSPAATGAHLGQWWRLAADLRARGCAGRGDLVLDDSLFDEDAGARLGAVTAPRLPRAGEPLSANFGAFACASPGAAPGSPCRQPIRRWLSSSRNRRTGRRRSKSTLSVERTAVAGAERVR